MLLLDVSEYQGSIDWPRVAQHFKAVYIKASEGVTWNDPDFQRNRKEANAAGLRVGAYHFADFNLPGKEATHFALTVQKIGRRDLKPVLDLEAPIPHGVDPVRWVHIFNAVVRTKLGVWPMLYSYGPYIDELHLDRPLGDGLWLAAYGRNDGKEYPVYTPLPWKRYVAHQFTSKGRTPGINGYVDVSDAPRGVGPLLAHPILGRF